MLAPTPPQPGQILAGKYRVEGVLGQGGMGMVLAATHLELDRPVALKLLLPQALADPVMRERFQREGRASSKLRSPHVAQVIDVGKLETGEPFIVMEYLVGQDLGRCVETLGQLPIADAVDYVAQACEAIAEAHEAGLVHRDLKPANLFLTRGYGGAPCIKVLDFGISKNTAQDGQGLTSTSAVMGSPLYMSPEQLEASRNVDTRTDIWALGAILFELLAGRVPFDGNSLAIVMLGILREPTPSLRALRADVPAPLDAAVAACLEKDRARRPANVAAFLRSIVPYGSSLARTSLENVSRLASGTAQTVLGEMPGPLLERKPSNPGTMLSQGIAPPVAAATGGQTGGAWGATSEEIVLPTRGSMAPIWIGLALVASGGAFLVHRATSAGGAAPSAETAQSVSETAPSAPAAAVPVETATPVVAGSARETTPHAGTENAETTAPSEVATPPAVAAAATAAVPAPNVAVATHPAARTPPAATLTHPKAPGAERPNPPTAAAPKPAAKPSDLFSDRQ